MATRKNEQKYNIHNTEKTKNIWTPGKITEDLGRCSQLLL